MENMAILCVRKLGCTFYMKISNGYITDKLRESFKKNFRKITQRNLVQLRVEFGAVFSKICKNVLCEKYEILYQEEFEKSLAQEVRQKSDISARRSKG